MWRQLEKKKIWTLVLTLSSFGTMNKFQMGKATSGSGFKTKQISVTLLGGPCSLRASHYVMNGPDPKRVGIQHLL